MLPSLAAVNRKKFPAASIPVNRETLLEIWKKALFSESLPSWITIHSKLNCNQISKKSHANLNVSDFSKKIWNPDSNRNLAPFLISFKFPSEFDKKNLIFGVAPQLWNTESTLIQLSWDSKTGNVQLMQIATKSSSTLIQLSCTSQICISDISSKSHANLIQPIPKSSIRDESQLSNNSEIWFNSHSTLKKGLSEVNKKPISASSFRVLSEPLIRMWNKTDGSLKQLLYSGGQAFSSTSF